MQAKTSSVVVFRSAAQRIALLVDEVLGNQEVVVKNLGPQLSRLPGLAGMSVLASGAVVTESVFAWPGVGSLFVDSLAKRDYAVLMAFLMCGSAVVVALNLVSDVVAIWLDPRRREASR